MNTDKLFIVFGSDSRFKYTAEALREMGYEVSMFDDLPAARLSQLDVREKVVVLPLPFTRDNKSVNLPSLPYAVTLNGITGILKRGDAVFGGMLSEDFAAKVKQRSAEVYDYYDENMIVRNAELTALALMKLLNEMNLDKTALKFAVTGFGRTAKATAKEFSDCGIDFEIVARSKAAEIAVKSMNYRFVKLEHFTEKAGRFDVIINTVPALIFNEALLSALKPDVTLIDIASAPYGVTQKDADRFGIKLIRALSLPGRYLPEKAGRLIAESIEQHLKGR